MNVDGSGQTNLTNHEADDNWPTMSPDGTQIAFLSDRDGNWEIYLINTDGTGLTRLTDTPEWEIFPVWSPDGTQIAFMREFDVLVMNIVDSI
jgi:TolB protein